MPDQRPPVREPDRLGSRPSTRRRRGARARTAVPPARCRARRLPAPVAALGAGVIGKALREDLPARSEVDGQR
ncbi:hypothetical protein PV318_06470 [Streptomyces sp. ME02-6991-2B]|nr:hypothetical protein [Streptomyces sp. ME02-6991-2B]